ncbi:formaldehyde-responsive transcriptional repressor FrmR [Escherichia coli]|nr:formaldehyde-responsive transcriptional repressor FrmR [Escherichia coli]MBW6100573.1 formaldehyde-responsive transcriptional repressor FrmR [Escherichia coli]
MRNAQYSGREEKRSLLEFVVFGGQIDALERSLEGDAECRAILQQIAAVRGAANGLMAEVLESHIRETFDRNDCYSREVSQSVDDTIELVRAYLK